MRFRSRGWRVLVGLVVFSLGAGVATVSGAADPVGTPAPVAVVGVAAPRPGGVTGLRALPSLSPAAGFEGGGGGLAGSVWGLFGDLGDASAVMRAGGVQVDLGAPGWGPGATFAVFEAGTLTQVWPASGTSTTSVVPPGTLRNGGAYEVAVTVNGETTRRPFTVDAGRAQAVAGMETTEVASPPVTVNTGQKMGLGVQFSSADVGVSPTTGAVGRLSVGLPAGWSWSGVGADVWRVAVVNGSASLPGVDRVVQVFGSTGVVLLGCHSEATVSVCDVAGGQLVGEGPRAVVDADGSVVLTEQSVGQALTFDPAGRLVRIAQPGGPPLDVTYTAAGGLATVTWMVGAAPLVWRAFYAGDTECDDSALAPGFVATPGGFVCGWTVPSGSVTRLMYTQPAGALVPRLSRAMQLPVCAASMADCDPNLTVVADFGWDATNRLVALRDALAARVAMAGLIDPSDASHWQHLTYDAEGRLSSTQTPTPVVDARGRLAPQANTVTSRMAYTAAEAGFAPATHQLALTTSGTAGSLTTITASDDGGRTTADRQASGAVTRMVWAPFVDLLLGTLRPNGQADTTVFDQWFRRIAKYAGPLADFGPGCAPDSPQRGTTDPVTANWTACAPATPTSTQVTSQLLAFDDPAGVGNGLTAAVFAPAAAGLPSPFSGNPTGHAAADQTTGTEPGIPIAAVAPTATTGSGVRLDGGLVVPLTAGTNRNSWTVRVGAPSDLIMSGVAVIDGRFCALLTGGTGGGEGSCTLTPDAESRAQHIIVDLQLARPPTPDDRVTVELQDPFGDLPLLDNSFLVRRWSADTDLTNHDPVPAGSIAGWSDTTVTTHKYTCGTAAEPLAAQTACVGSAAIETHDPARLNLAYTYTYGPDPFGGVRLATATRPDGQGTTTYEYWGLDDTAAGLAHADQLGRLVTVPQRGLPKTVTLPGGRATTTVYDDYGSPVCQQVDGGNWTCTTFDVTRRPVTHVLRADQPGVAPVTITMDYAPAGNPLINRTTRSDATGTATEQTVLDPTGRVLEYTDTLGTTTDHAYDTLGRLTTTAITPPAVPGLRGRPRPSAAPAPAFTYTTQFDPSTGLEAGLTFQGRPLVAVAYGEPGQPWLPTTYTYTLTGGTVTAQIDYDSQFNPYGRSWTFADGTRLLDCATTHPAPAACTPQLGDTFPGTTASGRTLARTVDGQAFTYTYDTAHRLTAAHIGASSYGYAWDPDNNLVGRTITSPKGADAFTYTYNDADQLTATSDPQAAIPATGAFDADDNHTAIGADTYTYDALHQLAATTNTTTTTATTISYTRDPHGRITTHTTTPGGAYHLGYSLADDQRPTVTIDPTGVATPLLGLPGGLLYRGPTQGPIVTDTQGNSLLTLTPNGHRPTTATGPQPVTLYEPFGAPTPDSPTVTSGPGADFGWQQNQTDGPVSHLGVRDLHTRLGTFLEPDPRPHGSQAGPYSYTNADPVNQTDSTGLCVGWGCVKEANEFLQPIATLATLFACVLGFGIGCFVTSLIQVALSVLNFAADFPLHQDAAADGVTAAMGFLNLAVAVPIFYELGVASRLADELGTQEEAVTTALKARTAELNGPATQRDTFAEIFYGEDAQYSAYMEKQYTQMLDFHIIGAAKWRSLLAGTTLFTSTASYGVRITSDNLYGCCWKLW